jgi:methylated-DNA-[protein]-cysteine S-methyltransferase
MITIPYGETLTYGQIAKRLNSHARAVGSACGLNPIPIIIPCHRVIGANGKLVGFSGGEGVETKIHLLELEGAGFDRFLPLF